ncbi:MAG: DNA methylase, partial [Lachnospiraceae bacterium]|nr:DNA methylase [Lachnospiraceae bacterium]
MAEGSRAYVAIDLKSFYASVECRERGLDPLTARLVVADESRTEKTICLAVTPALKAFGVPGRPRLFEVVQMSREKGFDFMTAKPRMALYMKYSTRIYSIYLRYVAPEDIFAYSVDEVFIDVTSYLHIYDITPHELTIKMIREVQKETGITATAGIGTNMYLAKIAMDIVAKHMNADKDGVRIAEIDERSYRELLWDHVPITDFWRVGRGTAKRLASHGLYTMGDV